VLPVQNNCAPLHVQPTHRVTGVSARLGSRSRRRRQDPAVRLRCQAAAAARCDRPVTWLAALLYALDVTAPRGASANTGRVGALLVASGDFGSGRRSRPGRLLSAQMLGVSERTIERHWRIIERAELAAVTAAGRHLSAERFAAVADDGERARWRDRQEWHLVLTAPWLRDLDADALAPYKDRARALLGGGAGASLVDNPANGREPGSGRVAPSRKGCSRGSSSGSNWFPSKPKPTGTTSNSTRPGGRTEQSGAASRPSPTTERGGRRSGQAGRRMPREAVQLARDVLARGRFPWLYRTRRPVVVAALRPYAATGWTARDVEEAVAAQLRERRFSVPAEGPARPVSYLLWLLSGSDLAHPPAQQRDAAVVAAAAGRAARQDAERDQAIARVTVPAAELAARDPEFATLRAAGWAPGRAGRRSAASWDAAEREAAAARARGR
jgi:hypothetical protein